jgi:hypothetical protein
LASLRIASVLAAIVNYFETSLEGWPSSSEPLEPGQRAEAMRVFNQIVSYYEPSQTDGPYKSVTLIRLIYEYARSRDNFLSYFFKYMER